MIKNFTSPAWETLGGMPQQAVVPVIAKAVIGAAVSKVASSAFSKKPKSNSGQLDAAQLAVQRRQQKSLDAQQAAVNRQRADADKREAQLSGEIAGQRRAVLARRRSRGQLAYSGPNTGLKQTLGG